MRRSTLVAGHLLLLLAPAAHSQVPIVDGAANEKRTEDKDHSAADIASKAQQQKAKKGVRCNFTQQGGSPAKARGQAGSAGAEGANSVKTAIGALPTATPVITGVGASVVSAVSGYSGGLSTAVGSSNGLLQGNAPILGTDALFIAAWGSNQAVRTQGAQLTNQALSAVALMVQLLNLRGQQDLAQNSGGVQFMSPGGANPFSAGAVGCDSACLLARSLAAKQGATAIAGQNKALEEKPATPASPGPDTSSDAENH